MFLHSVLTPAVVCGDPVLFQPSMMNKNIRSSPAHVFNTKAARLKVLKRPRCVPQVHAVDKPTVGVVGLIPFVPPGGGT